MAPRKTAAQKKTEDSGTGLEEILPQTTAKKTTARKAPAKKTAAKKTTAKRPSGTVKVKVITSVDYVPGRDTEVYFSDGSHATVKKGNELAVMLSQPENVAPNMIAVTISGKNIVSAERVDTPAQGE